MSISDKLNTGKSTKLSFIKSRTYPKRILSSILLKIPAVSIDIKNSASVDTILMCLTV